MSQNSYPTSFPNFVPVRNDEVEMYPTRQDFIDSSSISLKTFNSYNDISEVVFKNVENDSNDEFVVPMITVLYCRNIGFRDHEIKVRENPKYDPEIHTQFERRQLVVEVDTKEFNEKKKLLDGMWKQFNQKFDRFKNNVIGFTKEFVVLVRNSDYHPGNCIVYGRCYDWYYDSEAGAVPVDSNDSISAQIIKLIKRNYCVSTRLQYDEVISRLSAENLKMMKSIDLSIIRGCLEFEFWGHFIPLVKELKIDWVNIEAQNALRLFMEDESYWVNDREKEDQITPKNHFIFNDNDELFQVAFNTTKERSERSLNNFVGGYLSDLDLSKTFITGSSMTYSLFNNQRTKINNDAEHRIKNLNERILPREKLSKAQALKILYPVIVTKFSDHDLKAVSKLRDTQQNDVEIQLTTSEKGYVVVDGQKVPFTVKSGSDVDMAIDDSLSLEAYEKVVLGHYEVIKRHYPYAKIKSYLTQSGRTNYTIYTSDPKYVPTFRTVELYQANLGRVCSHHVGTVRACYTKYKGENRFFATASALLTSLSGQSPNYNYFIGKKSNPQDIIIKNINRGFSSASYQIMKLIVEYCLQEDIVVSNLPFLRGRNLPFSIYAYKYESEVYYS